MSSDAGDHQDGGGKQAVHGESRNGAGRVA